MNILRKASIPVVIASLLFLAACSSTSFMGLSKSSYVDGELEKIRAEMESVEAMRIAQEQALAEKAANEEALEELIRLAEGYSDRLDEIPEQTLRELMKAIELYLADEPASETPAETAAPEGTESPQA